MDFNIVIIIIIDVVIIIIVIIIISHDARYLTATVSEGLAQGPYVAARAGVEPMTPRTKDVDSINAQYTPPVLLLYSLLLVLVQVNVTPPLYYLPNLVLSVALA